MNPIQELFTAFWPALKSLPASRKKLAEEAYLAGYQQALKDAAAEATIKKAKGWLGHAVDC